MNREKDAVHSKSAFVPAAVLNISVSGFIDHASKSDSNLSCIKFVLKMNIALTTQTRQ